MNRHPDQMASLSFEDIFHSLCEDWNKILALFLKRLTLEWGKIWIQSTTKGSWTICFFIDYLKSVTCKIVHTRQTSEAHFLNIMSHKLISTRTWDV